MVIKKKNQFRPSCYNVRFVPGTAISIYTCLYLRVLLSVCTCGHEYSSVYHMQTFQSNI